MFQKLKKLTGSYTNYHEKGKYHGKGPESRAKTSANEKAKKHSDPLLRTDWKSSNSDREAFKDESKRIESDKVGDTPGHKNPKNYNNIRSPGDTYRKKDKD